jgi:hypothetical protein
VRRPWYLVVLAGAVAVLAVWFVLVVVPLA